MLGKYHVFRNGTVAVAICFILGQSAFAAGPGEIKGKVFDKKSKEALPGAIVEIKGTSLGAVTDLNGNYQVFDVPSGKVSLMVSYIGYRSATEAVTVPANKSVTHDVYLIPEALKGQEVIVTAQGRGQTEAINQELSSNTIENVVSSEQIQQLPDFNAAEAIGRLPGVYVLRSAGEGYEIAIRGMAPQYNLVAINGISLPSTNGNDNGINLQMITPNMLKSIQVKEAITPDMNADAVGGYVNMELRQAPKGFHANLLYQEGYTSLHNKYNYKAVGSASDRFFSNKLGMYLLGDVEQWDASADQYNASYQVEGLGQNGAPAPLYMNSMNLFRHLQTSGRYGVNLILDYNLPHGALTAINFFARLNQDYTDYQTLHNVSSNQLEFNVDQANGHTDIATNTLQGKYDFGFMSMDFTASNEYSRNSYPYIPKFIFYQPDAMSSLAFQPNPLPMAIVSATSFDLSNTYLQGIQVSSTSFKENRQTGKLDFKLPFNYLSSFLSGFFKFGGEFYYIGRANYDYNPSANVFNNITITDAIHSAFPQLQQNPAEENAFLASDFTDPNTNLTADFLGGKYGPMYWMPSFQLLDPILNYISHDKDSAFVAEQQWLNGPVQTLENNYTEIESYSAGYAMAQLHLGPNLMVVGGARYEDDDARFSAYNMVDTGFPLTQPYSRELIHNINHYWLPMVQARYDVTNWFGVRYAYTQTLARQNFTSVSPHWTDHEGVIAAGNPELQPGLSISHDLEFYFHSNVIGLITFDGFYKTIKDFVYSTQYPLFQTALPGFFDVGDFPGALVGDLLNITMNNPHPAYQRGFEINLEHRFWYLSSPFNGILIDLNYTHIWSNTNYPLAVVKLAPGSGRIPHYVVEDSAQAGSLLNQPGDMANGTIGYDYEGFSGRVSVVYYGNVLNGVGFSLTTTANAYFRVDAAFSQNLPWKGLQLYLNLNNINSRPDVTVIEMAGAPVPISEQFYGLTAELGVRYTL